MTIKYRWTAPRRRLLWLLYAARVPGKVMAERLGITDLSVRSAISRIFEGRRPRHLLEALSGDELQWLANRCEHREPHEVMAELIRDARSSRASVGHGGAARASAISRS